jgi:predicted NBD/HSP70 family sugar kinase
MGSGIGSGIVIDGTIYHGLSANVGEIGHVTVNALGPACPCGSRGCLELYAGPKAIMEKATDAVARGDLNLTLTGKTSVDFATLGTAATRGDTAAAALIQESADYLAAALVSMVNLFDLPLIMLAGNAFSTAGSIYVQTISRVLAERAMVRDIHPIEVRMSVNGNDAAALGAATLVLQDRLSPRSLRSVAFA